MEKKQNPIMLVLPMICTAVLVAFDQYIKHLCVAGLKGQDPIVLIPGVLEFNYLENHGAAFGMLQNQQWFFWILTVIFIGIALWFFVRVPKTKHYFPLIASVTVLFSGAIGNFIDRISYKYVVDFIYFKLINFPVFNIADIYVTLSVIAMVALVLFVYKEGELDFLEPKKNK